MGSDTKILGLRSRAPSVLLSVLVASVAILLASLLLSGYRERIGRSEIEGHNIAMLLQTHVRESFSDTAAELAALALDVSSDVSDPGGAVRFGPDAVKLASKKLAHRHAVGGLYMVGADGVVASLSEGGPVPEPNLSDGVFFRELRTGPPARLVFSEAIKDDIADTEILLVARAIRDRNDRFVGAVFRAFSIASIRRSLAVPDVGEDGFVAFRRRGNNALVASWPEKRTNDNSVRAAALADIDGSRSRNYILSSSNMEGYPFYVEVAVARNEVLAGWYVQVIVVGISMLVVLGLVMRLVQRLGRMRQREVLILSDLARSESQFSELVQMVPVGIARLDAGGRCLFVNDCNLLITGRGRQSLIGNDWSSLIHPDDRQSVWESWARSGAGGGRTCEYRLVRPDGGTVHVIGEASAERNSDGTVTAYVIAQMDISRLKRVENELMAAKQLADQANQAKTRFLATASHDLRQPIQAINLFKDALCRTELSEEQKTIARFLSLSVNSLSNLLYSLLDISKLDAGLVQPQCRQVRVEEIFAAVDDEFSSLAQQRNLRFKFFYPFNSPVLETDPGLLHCVLRNLIDNAFKYTAAGGVLVGYRKRLGSGIIQIWDTGIGVDTAVGDRIFEECFQIGNISGDRAKGLGIGLSIARRTARLLGGDVSYHSRLGKGSVFEIWIPARPPRGEAVPQERQAVAALPAVIDSARFKGWTVVVIEDDPVVAKAIQLSLQAEGIAIEHFSSAEDALASPTLIGRDFYISDLVLPGRNGVELLDTIQERSSRAIRAVLMTGETSPERMEITGSSGWRVILKPAGLASLLSVMNDIVDAAGSEQRCRQ